MIITTYCIFGKQFHTFYLAGDDSISARFSGIFHAATDPLANYKTEYHRIKTLRAKGLVEPREVAVGSRLDCRSSGVHTIASTVQYVPLLDTLSLLYSKPEFRQAVESSTDL